MQARRVRTQIMALALAGCADADDRYQEFVDQVIDAGSAGEVDGMAVGALPDITGDWLLGARLGVAPGLVIRFRVSFVLTPVSDSTGPLDFEARALEVATGAPVGDPLTATDVEVGGDASFAAPLQGTLPGPANPVSRQPTALDAVLAGTLQSADFVCGTLSGTAGWLPLEGTTWGAVRVTGDSLPAAVTSCDDAPPP